MKKDPIDAFDRKVKKIDLQAEEDGSYEFQCKWNDIFIKASQNIGAEIPAWSAADQTRRGPITIQFSDVESVTVCGEGLTGDRKIPKSSDALASFRLLTSIQDHFRTGMFYEAIAGSVAVSGDKLPEVKR